MWRRIMKVCTRLAYQNKIIIKHVYISLSVTFTLWCVRVFFFLCIFCLFVFIKTCISFAFSVTRHRKICCIKLKIGIIEFINISMHLLKNKCLGIENISSFHLRMDFCVLQWKYFLFSNEKTFQSDWKPIARN